MGFSSRSSDKGHYEDTHRGSNYYKRDGFLSRLFKMFGSFSNSNRRYSKYSSHRKSYSDNKYYSNQNHHRRKYKSSWS